MHNASGIFFLTVVDRRVTGKALANATIGLQFIGHQVGIFTDPVVNHRSKVEQFLTFNRKGSNRAIALNSDQHSLFSSAPAAFMFDTLLVAGFSANEFFVYLYDAR